MAVDVISDTKKLDALLKSLGDESPVWVVSDRVDYGIHQEFGFVHKSGNHVSGKPFMRPAVEEIRPAFDKGWGVVIDKNLDPENFVASMAFKVEGVAKREAPYEFGNLKSSIKAQPAKTFLENLENE